MRVLITKSAFLNDFELGTALISQAMAELSVGERTTPNVKVKMIDFVTKRSSTHCNENWVVLSYGESFASGPSSTAATYLVSGGELDFHRKKVRPLLN